MRIRRSLIFSIVRTLILLLLCSSLESIANGEDARFVTIKIENRSPEFEAVAWIYESGGARKAFAPAAIQNVLESTIHLSNDWFTEVDIKIAWKIKINGEERHDPGHWVQLRFTRDFQNDSYTIPIYFGYDLSTYEMDRLDKLINRNDQWEVYFRMVQIARNYQDDVKYKDWFNRAARRAFYSAVALTEKYTPYIILMSDDVMQLVGDFHGSFEERANLARSAIWKELSPMVRKYAEKNDCDTVKLILTAYQTLKDREPVIFQVSKENPQVLKQLSVDIAPNCPGLAGTGDIALTGSFGIRQHTEANDR